MPKKPKTRRGGSKPGSRAEATAKARAARALPEGYTNVVKSVSAPSQANEWWAALGPRERGEWVLRAYEVAQPHSR